MTDKKTITSEYWEFCNRNSLIISPKLQEKIFNCRLLFIGCGLASKIATEAVRLGFSQFTLCDGDQVELSNLNRQDFTQLEAKDHVNKAQAVASRITSIAPWSSVKVVQNFLKPGSELEALINDSDIIINSADPGEILFEIDEIASRQGKPVINPFNIGDFPLVVVTKPDSKRMAEIIDRSTPEQGLFFNIVMTAIGGPENLPQELSQVLREHGEAIMSGAQPAPQLSTASSINAGVVVAIMKDWLSGSKIKAFPESYYLSYK